MSETANKVSIALVRWAVIHAISDFSNWAEYVVMTVDEHGGVSVVPHWLPHFDPGRDAVFLGVLAAAILEPDIDQTLSADGVGEVLKMEDLSPEYISHLKKRVRNHVLPLYDGIHADVFARLKWALETEGEVRFNRNEIL